MDRCFNLLKTPAPSLPPSSLFHYQFLELAILLNHLLVDILVICQSCVFLFIKEISVKTLQLRASTGQSNYHCRHWHHYYMNESSMLRFFWHHHLFSPFFLGCCKCFCSAVNSCVFRTETLRIWSFFKLIWGFVAERKPPMPVFVFGQYWYWIDEKSGSIE